MAKITGIDHVSPEQLEEELRQGGRFVVYQYVISVLVLTFRRSSAIIYLPPGASAAARGLPYTLITLLLGWWGFPWGFIYTPAALFTNLTGGKDVTREVAAELFANAAD